MFYPYQQMPRVSRTPYNFDITLNIFYQLT
uniref:Uncharacterized protein n=1 Tax=Rhizophora mucronata TaxID=61149 RepID=A0A2P2PBN8_RHIMU